MTVRLLSEQEKKELQPTKKQRFTRQQKFNIIQEAETIKNYLEVSQKYNVSRVALYNWKNQIISDPEGFLSQPNDKRTSHELNLLNKEIDQLKDIIVQQAKEITLLKKSVR